MFTPDIDFKTFDAQRLLNASIFPRFFRVRQTVDKLESEIQQISDEMERSVTKSSKN